MLKASIFLQSASIIYNLIHINIKIQNNKKIKNQKHMQFLIPCSEFPLLRSVISPYSLQLYKNSALANNMKETLKHPKKKSLKLTTYNYN